MGRYHYYLLTGLILSSKLLASSSMFNSISFQGFTGLINTPNAQVMEEGEISFVWNNQVDYHLLNYDYSEFTNFTDDYIFAVGLFKNLEIQGRLKEQPNYARDLSANAKFKLPKLYSWMPNIAIGVQDFGSKANLYENYYIVADQKLGDFRASLGYGYNNSSRAKRMDGVFGGIEFQPFSFLSLMAEYDGKEKHAGIRVQTPKLFDNRLQLVATIASNLSNDNDLSFQVGFSFFPEGKRLNKIKTPTPINLIKADDRNFQNLVCSLERAGLKDIKISYLDNILIIEYDNPIYRHNDIDAFAKVLKETIPYTNSFDRLILKRKKSQLVIESISMNPKFFLNWIKKPTSENLEKFILSINSETDDIKGNAIACGVLSERFRTHIEFAPILKTMVGTEVGVLDYQLLFGTTVKMNLAKGLDFSFKYNSHLTHSKDFDPDEFGVFGYLYDKGGLYSAMLHYSTQKNGFLNTISGGLYRYEYFGIVDQLSYNYKEHYFNLKLGYFKHFGEYKHPDWQDDKKIILAKYTYNYYPLDLQLSLEGGEYWNQDIGGSFELRKYFGDVAVSLKYLQTKPQKDQKYFGWNEESNKYVGIYFELPLDSKKSKTSWRYIQLEGDKAFEHGVRSTIARKDGSNKILPGNGDNPKFDIEHSKYFYNRNRVGDKYIKENIDRVLDLF